MNIKCNNQVEADALAKELRGHYRGTDWVVAVHRPLFDGDDWRVVVS